MVKIVAGWNRFWFAPADPINLGAIRIVTGAVLFWTHLSTLPDLLRFIGPGAIVDREALRQLRHVVLDPASPAGLLRSGDQSIWYYFDQPWLIWTVHALFLVATICFTIGLFSRAAAVVVWFGHVSYIQRAVLIYFGFDAVIAMLLFYMIFAPTGAALSLDSQFRNRSRSADVPSNVVLRLIQLHICVIYFASGIAKLFGLGWRNGSAVYQAIHMTDVALFDFGLLGGNERFWLIVSRFGSLFTIAVELGFPLLVWNRWTRWPALISAWMLQLGIALFLCLGSFQAAMFAATLAFVPPATLRALVVRSRRLVLRSAAPA